MRYPLVIGNWKLNGNIKFIKKFVFNLCNKVDELLYCNIVIAPPCMYLMKTKELLKDNKVFLGAQNSDFNLTGAFTGDISPIMLKEIGVKYVIVGHSERRIFHHEDDIIVAKKFELLVTEKLIPVLCIGETKNEYLNNATEQICKKQIDAVLNIVGIKGFQHAVIAYEPIWAIGSGKTPQPNLVQKIHKFIRTYLAEYDINIGKNIIIQYGGSVSIHNVYEFSIQPDIDGVLVGSSALKFDEFIYIVNTFAKSKYCI